MSKFLPFYEKQRSVSVNCFAIGGDEFVRVVNDQHNTWLDLPYEVIQFSSDREWLGRLSIGLETPRIGIPDETNT